MPQSTTATASDDKDDNAPKPRDDQEASSDSDSDSSGEDEDLVLEGVIVRNPDVSDSDDTSSEEEDDDDDDDDDNSPPPSKKAKTAAASSKPTQTKKPKTKKKKKTKKEAGPEIVQVDFTFCDMHEKYFHGLKTLLTASSPVYAAHSSPLADLMIENVSVGTITSTEGDTEGTVFGFASVLNTTVHKEKPCVRALVETCLDKCPEDRKKELSIVLSGQTKRPAGLYLHGRMVNLPLELVQVLHQQLVLDMDWAVEHAQGGEAERKSLDFGAFVLLAPSYKGAGGVSHYKNFDDEIFASHAEFTYEMELPKPFGAEEAPRCTVVVMTKTGHRAAMQSLEKMVGGTGA